MGLGPVVGTFEILAKRNGNEISIAWWLSKPLISKIGLDRASIVGKLKPTAAILE